MRKVIAATMLTGTLALAPVVESVHAQDDSAAESDDDSDNTGLFGLIGLAGLLGLLGLRRRDDRRTYSTDPSVARRT